MNHHGSLGGATGAQDGSKLPPWALEAARCPGCGGALAFGKGVRCLSDGCGALFPVVGGVPVLLHPTKSLFSMTDCVPPQPVGRASVGDRLSRLADALAPSISANIKAKDNYRRLAGLLVCRSRNPRVLVLGGRVLGRGLEQLLRPPIEVLETDVAFGPRTATIVDAHYIPFADGSFDCVIAQALLEHVIDPYRCVAEIHRVLKPSGVVYAETAFMQQVHGGRLDFTRFTRVGHRRLFGHFEEIESGAVCGTGMALGWAYEHFLISLVRSSTLRRVARLFARLTAFWLKYVDYVIIDHPGTIDGASGYYFLGRRCDERLEDSRIVAFY